MRFNDLLHTILANRNSGAGSVVTRWRQCMDLLAQFDVSGEPVAAELTPERAARIEEMLLADRSVITLSQRLSSVVELGGRLRSARLVRLLVDDHPVVASAAMARARLSDEDWCKLVPGLGPLARSILRRREDLGAHTRNMLDRFGSVDLTLTDETGRHDVAKAVPPQTGLLQAGPPQISKVVCQLEAETPLRSPPVDLPEAPVTAKASVTAKLAEGSRTVEASSTDSESDGHIRRIVERIERFRAERSNPAPPEAILEAPQREAPKNPADPVKSFGFMTDMDGIITSAENVSRAAVVGLTIGQAVADGRSGADGHALGAFRRRAAIRDARFTVDAGQLSGTWRVTAEPCFDQRTGRFQGYTGTARREFVHEQIVHEADDNRWSDAGPAPSTSGWAGMSAAAARQLVHELRTPLNAIQGYAEMIAEQLAGPVSDEYRAMAATILSDARELLSTFEDLDMASRLARGDVTITASQVDAGAMVRMAADRFGQDGLHPIDLVIAKGDLNALVDPKHAERMITHLFRVCYAALGDNEEFAARLEQHSELNIVRLSIGRPACLLGQSEQQLFDQQREEDMRGEHTPPLGLAFTLRLVRGLVRRTGGQLHIRDHQFDLDLPCRNVPREEQGQRS